MNKSLSIITNVANADLPRIQNILPHWLKTFGDLFDELLIIYDNNELSGRISRLHKNKYYSSAEIIAGLDKLKLEDSRVKVINLDKTQIKPVSSAWFKKGAPFRCHSGSPIYPFIFGIHQAKNDFILKCDCDILFYENGFVKEAFEQLSKFDVVTPPRFILTSHIVSSRGFFINRKNIYNNILPIALPELGLFQKISRLFRGQNIFDDSKFSAFYSFEDSLNNAIRHGLMSHYHIPSTYGNSLHVCTNQEADDPFLSNVINSFVHGIWPIEQNIDMNYLKHVWVDFFKKYKYS